MSKSISVSIIIPVYNEESHLRGCLESIDKQTVMPEEVIVVDNNSTDKTVKVAESFAFVRVVHEKKQGVLFARDRGFNSTKADIIGRIDADSVLSPDWVEVVKGYFSLHKDVGAITGDCYFYDFPTKSVFKIIHHTIYYWLQKIISGTEILWGSNMAIRRNTWEGVRDLCLKKTDVHEDIDLSLRLQDQDIEIVRCTSLIAGVSLRRGSLDPFSNLRYLRPWTLTYWGNQRYFQAIFIALVTVIILIITFIPSCLYWVYLHFTRSDG